MSFLSSTRVRRVSILLSGATAAAVLLPLPAMAGGAPSTTPTITVPSNGDTVITSPVTVTATSTASKVRFIVGLKATPLDQKTVDVVAGTASTTLDVLGVTGSTIIRAADCDVVGTTCNEVSEDTATVTVNLQNPSITSPTNGAVVGNQITLKADAPGGKLQVRVDGHNVGSPGAVPLNTKVSLKAKSQGSHTISVQQCNAAGTVCDGDSDSVSVIKDTEGPKWSDVNTSNNTVFPIHDGYKDTTKLSAKVGERSLETKVEIKKAGGPIVRTMKLGRVDRGRVNVVWNGHKNNGDLAAKGKYLFHFAGTDVHGISSKSSEKVVYVSDKKLVKKHVTRSVTARGSFAGNGSGACSGVYKLRYPQSRFGWRTGLGYYSQSTCNGSARDDVAIALHKAGAPNAVKYGSLRIDTYGGGAYRTPGPGVILYLTKSNQVGASKKVPASVGWHRGPTSALDRYIKSGKIRWAFATTKGNWYDVKGFKISMSYWVLR